MAYPTPPPGISSLPSRPPAAASDGATVASAAPVTYYSVPSSYISSPQPAGSDRFSHPTSAGRAAPPSSYGRHDAPSSSAAASLAYYPGGAPSSYGPTAARYAPQSLPPSSSSHAAYYAQGSAQSGAGYPAGASAPPHGRRIGPASDYDPDMAAALATWQSGYVTRDPSDRMAAGFDASAGGDGAASGAAAHAAHDEEGNKERKMTVMREGGGKTWSDDTLLEWDPAHLRIFVGNLGGETTDNGLLAAFSNWSSVQKARVIRDKVTNKSKGFGFVSFADADEFFQAAREMDGKYIGSHPVRISKAKTEIKPIQAKDRDGNGRNKRNRNRNKNKDGSGGDGAGTGADKTDKYDPVLGPMHASRITKPGKRTKDGLKLLG